MKIVKKFLTPYRDVIFPATCVCCGSSVAGDDTFLCVWCKNERFEPAGFTDGEILPEMIRFRFAMWHFDKGGYLQKLLHDLKYQFLRGAGRELGEYAGHMFLARTDERLLEEIGKQDPLLVPVPLHPSKRRKRGYNQAMALAEGVSRVTSWDVAGQGTVLRVKKTKTQTGLDISRREKNLEGAFSIKNGVPFQNRFPVIVDDVFTTGATTFEMAKTILQEVKGRAGIITAAKA
jgi:ComF family protein